MMPATRRAVHASYPSLSPRLRWPEVLQLGALGIASDIRDRHRDPTLRNRLSARALDPRLRRPIFIIGAPRSGTTFLGNCIGRLPEVSYHFEPRLTKAAAQYVYEGTWRARRSSAVFRFSYAALLLAALDGGRRFADKTPENSFIVSFLAELLPTAQFVHIVRDGRDAAVSHAEKPWLAAASAASERRGRARQLFGPYPRWWVESGRRDEFAAASDIVRSAWCWRRFTEAALEQTANLPGDRAIEVRYEGMVADPTGTARSIAHFLGTSGAGLEMLTKAMADANAGSVGRWQKVLSERDAADVEREIGPLLDRLGYA